MLVSILKILGKGSRCSVSSPIMGRLSESSPVMLRRAYKDILGKVLLRYRNLSICSRHFKMHKLLKIGRGYSVFVPE